VRQLFHLFSTSVPLVLKWPDFEDLKRNHELTSEVYGLGHGKGMRGASDAPVSSVFASSPGEIVLLCH